MSHKPDSPKSDKLDQFFKDHFQIDTSIDGRDEHRLWTRIEARISNEQIPTDKDLSRPKFWWWTSSLALAASLGIVALVWFNQHPSMNDQRPGYDQVSIEISIEDLFYLEDESQTESTLYQEVYSLSYDS